jgi:hypothetical protein
LLPGTKAGAFTWARNVQASEQDGIAISMRDDRKRILSRMLSLVLIATGSRGLIHQTTGADR